MYRKFLLASVGAITLTGSAALAADLPSRAPPPVYLPPVPIFTWTGIYLGGQIGYGWATDNGSLFATDTASNAANGAFSSNPQGVIGGAHVGYNLQINQWVFGLEGSVDGTSMSGTSTFGVADNLGGTGSITASTSSDVQGSIRGRVGVAFDRALLYATGGVAFADLNTNYSDPSGYFGIPGATSSFSTTRVGWTVGGGIEYAVTNNWSIRAEYRYSDFGNFTDAPFPSAVLSTSGLPASAAVQHNWTQNQVQVGFSYKFDTFAPAPAVAKY
jgi:outer membrane immunogenic protein